MKRIAKLFALVALMCVPVLSFAQTNKEISNEYKSKISICKAEIKTIKAKLKLDKTDSSLNQQLIEKKSEFAELKSKKKVIDKAIKTEAAHEKAVKKAQKAKEEAEEAASAAKQIKRGY
jgi:hypothetical protein